MYRLILKLYTSESYTAITEHAMQIYGGYGFCMEYPIQRFFRDARLSVIGAGTSEIQRNIIAKSIRNINRTFSDIVCFIFFII